MQPIGKRKEENKLYVTGDPLVFQLPHVSWARVDCHKTFGQNNWFSFGF